MPSEYHYPLCPADSGLGERCTCGDLENPYEHARQIKALQNDVTRLSRSIQDLAAAFLNLQSLVAGQAKPTPPRPYRGTTQKRTMENLQMEQRIRSRSRRGIVPSQDELDFLCALEPMKEE